MIEAVIFDFDGTLIDTEGLWYRVCLELFRIHGKTLVFQDYLRCVGGSLDHYDPYLDLAVQLGEPERRREICRQGVAMFESAAHSLEPREGALELASALRARGIRLAIASSSPSHAIVPHLERLGVRGYFEILCSADDVKKVKPDPELYHCALGRLGLDAGQVLAVEDSPHGAHAAVAAGIRCLAVPHDLTRQQTFPPGVVMVEGFQNLDLDGIVEGLRG